MVEGDVHPFHRFARPYDRVMPPARQGLLEEGLSLADRAVDRLLDVGGGSGRASRSLSVDERVVVDAARGMLREARGHGMEAVQGDAARLPVGDERVDAVVVVDALHHMGDVQSVVSEARRVLRPGGVLVIRDFDPSTFRGRALVAVEHLVGFDSRFWTPETLCDRIAAAGLEPATVDGGFGYTVAATKPERESQVPGGRRAIK